jgi:integration host factor subunit beta
LGFSVTKSDLIQAISSRLAHLPARDVEIVINTMFESMTDALTAGDRIEIRGFGSFSVRHRRARMGRNPKTGDAIAVPPKRVPFFTVGHELRKRINDDFQVTKPAPDAETEVLATEAVVETVTEIVVETVAQTVAEAAVPEAVPAIETPPETVPTTP